MSQRILLDSRQIQITLNRLCCQLIEDHNEFKDTVIIGLQPRGIYLAERLVALLKSDYQIENVHYGILDITFFRDDFRRRNDPLKANATQMDFLIEGKRVILIDDVLFTGRSIRAALDAMQSFGRPADVSLCVLIDRRFSRHLPIQPDYIGHVVDAVASEKVTVKWLEQDQEDAVYLLRSENNE
jgi:pyrimidine operon attenuation protein/uracil phosphoribosyltransferase